MQLLTGIVRNYPWGSRTALARLRGAEPTDQREAEMWFGAHPLAPSLVGERTLIDVIADDPTHSLGSTADQGQGLPFLLKLLAADEVLSLQAHPSREQAKEGYARENEAGIALNAPHRNYKDDNHKPELIVALSEFEAMAGFRPVPLTNELFDVLACPELERYRSLLPDAPADSVAQGSGDNVRALFTTWITIPPAARVELISAVVASARAVLDDSSREVPQWMREALSNIVELNEMYPGDVGVLGALLLNKLTLQPGEALYLDAGNLHAYVRGLGVEIMANSDNVLRGGLTSKHVDVPELVKVLNFDTLEDARLAGEESVVEGARVVCYPVPIDEFALTRVELDGRWEVPTGTPTIIVCTEGTVKADDAATVLDLRAGEAAWIPAGNAQVVLEGSGQLFVATHA
ncbi:mannose-6-phosphate isomerase, class I [Corynebacterium argentoratense]|uniref:mannose-6-phosphate isomerase, class I n=1 Tax=Corynebacterium argentoratense TaxID=42817 RepID=UPI0028E5C4B8|nr:mannose-6-phosphate isomerase, class I [Corynebacterium argentoratense]